MFTYKSGQISIIPKPELRGFWGSSLIKPPFRVTSADVVIICPDTNICEEERRQHPPMCSFLSLTYCSRRQAHSRIVATQIVYLMIRSVQALLDICQPKKHQLFYSLQCTCWFALQCISTPKRIFTQKFHVHVHEYNILQMSKHAGNVETYAKRNVYGSRLTNFVEYCVGHA